MESLKQIIERSVSLSVQIARSMNWSGRPSKALWKMSVVQMTDLVRLHVHQANDYNARFSDNIRAFQKIKVIYIFQPNTQAHILRAAKPI